MRKVESSLVYRLLYPAVPGVLAAAHGVKVSAMPVVSLTSLSNDPPLIGFSSSPSHETYRTILKSRSFSISWLDRRFRKAVESLGTRSGRGLSDKLLESGLHHRMKGSPPTPVVAEASAYVVCSVDRIRAFGDHKFVIGLVVEAMAVEDFDEYWGFKSYRPILYAGLGRPSPEGSARRSDDL